MIPLRAALLLLLLAALPAWAGDTPPWPARVLEAVDGDSLIVLRGRRLPVQVRLYGADCPEHDQPGAGPATAAVEALVGHQVRVDAVDLDRYGRVVARVLLEGGRDLGLEQIRAGRCWWYQRYAPRERDYDAAQAEAQRERRGIWADPSPTPPWRWRRAEARP